MKTPRHHSYLPDVWWRIVPSSLLCGFAVLCRLGILPIGVSLCLGIAFTLTGVAFAVACCDMVDVVVASRRGAVVKWGLWSVVLFGVGLGLVLVPWVWAGQGG